MVGRKFNELQSSIWVNSARWVPCSLVRSLRNSPLPLKLTMPLLCEKFSQSPCNADRLANRHATNEMRSDLNNVGRFKRINLYFYLQRWILLLQQSNRRIVYAAGPGRSDFRVEGGADDMSAQSCLWQRIRSQRQDLSQDQVMYCLQSIWGIPKQQCGQGIPEVSLWQQQKQLPVHAYIRASGWFMDVTRRQIRTTIILSIWKTGRAADND